MALSYREMVPADTDAVLALRNQIFAPISRPAWEREGPMTAALACDGLELIGAIPLAYRNLKIGPDHSVSTAFENAVGTRADRRGHGVGGEMISSAQLFLRGRVDALCLYRGDERSDGYRFYRKTGHADLHYARRHQLDHPVPIGEKRVSVSLGVQAVCREEAECVKVFQSCYGSYGGFRHRERGFYSRALQGLIYESHPHDFHLLQYRPNGRLCSYAIVGVPTGDRDPKVVSVLEIASRDGEASLVRPLLNALSDLAHGLGRPAHAIMSDTSPALPALNASGYAARPRDFVILGKVLDPAATAEKVWRDEPTLRNTNVIAWTPGGEWSLHSARVSGAAHTLCLEMKDETLTRLLLARVRLAAAVETEEITVSGSQAGDLAALERALPFAPWCYHPLDYI